MKKINLILMLVLLGFGFTPFAQAAVLTAPETLLPGRIAISPYAQAVPNDSYTFIGISHPSLDSSKTQVGVALEVMGMTTVPDNAAGRVAIFTVDAGETHRVFVVDVNHSTINASNASFTDSRTHLIFTAASAEFGNVRITGINENPSLGKKSTGTAKPFLWDNLAQLNMWGVVYIEANGTGFAMEFIGDAQDSSIFMMHGATEGDIGLVPISDTTSNIHRTQRGRGIN